MSKKSENYVLVTTEHRGVFFGNLIEDNGKVVILENARNCVSWSSDVKGFMGLAANGPSERCRVGPAVPSIILRAVTSVSQCSDKAVEAWESEPWG